MQHLSNTKAEFNNTEEISSLIYKSLPTPFGFLSNLRGTLKLSKQRSLSSEIVYKEKRNQEKEKFGFRNYNHTSIFLLIMCRKESNLFSRELILSESIDISITYIFS